MLFFLTKNGQDFKQSFDLNGHTIEVIMTIKKGVSMARNMLIKNAQCDVGLFIDDDCVLAPGYAAAIEKAYSEFPKAEAIRFNTVRTYWNPVNAHATKDRKAKFSDLSSFGMWGLSFRPEAFISKGIFFDEHLGMPNYLYNGEDSVFLFDLCKKSEEVYLSSFYICEVKETKKSTWFEQFDKRYFRHQRLCLHPSLWNQLALCFSSDVFEIPQRLQDEISAGSEICGLRPRDV
jgi:hypothetical protein